MSIDMRDSQTPDSENTTPQTLENCTVVNEVTVEMILNDLAQGRNKEKIRQRYAYRDENARKKVLPFSFKGTTTTPTAVVTPEPKYGIPGTEGGHQFTPEVSITSEETNSTTTFNVENDDYAEIIQEEKTNTNLNTNN